MKSFILILFLLTFFSLQSCGGGEGGYITIDLEQQNETNKSETNKNDKQNEGEDDKEDKDAEDDKEGEDYEEAEDDKEGEDYENGNEEDGNGNSENEDNGDDNNGNGNSGDEDNGNGNNGNENNGDEEKGNEEKRNNTKTYDPIPTTPDENAYLYIDEISNEGIAHQSAACYGDYAFFISNKMIHVMVYNMRTNQRFFTLKQDPLGTGTIYHCNQACFGTQKYSEEDPFPLLYISQFQNKSNRCFITVFRILPAFSDADQEYSDFTFERIQTIYFPVATDENCLNNVNAVIDPNHRFIYTYSRNNNSAAENYQKCKISKFNLPESIAPGSVYLTNNDLLDSFFVDARAVNVQGGAYHNGMLYIGRGAPGVGYVYLYVVDLANQKLYYTIDLLNNGFTWEPEGAYFYNDNLYIGASNRIFKFSFQNGNSSAKAITIPFNMPK